MSGLHLLRPFSNWRNGRIKTVDEAEIFVNEVREQGFERFCTWTARRIAREGELKGGSVYFVKRNRLFRMPFIEVEREEHYFSIAMEPRLIRVEPLFVGFLRGWRYLERGKAPKDVETSMPADLAAAADKEFERRLVGAGGSS